MEKLPQTLVNVRVRDRGALEQAAEVHAAVERESAALEGRGRVLLRPSGTEPLVRVMVEAPTADEAEARLRAPGRARAGAARLTEAWTEGQRTGRERPRIVLTRRAAARARDPSEGGTAMCGIVGYVGQRSVQEILLAGLEKLEYRGYDSAGISIQGERRARESSAPSATCRR